eukprot:2250174-Rhodomonas_salina.1
MARAQGCSDLRPDPRQLPPRLRVLLVQVRVERVERRQSEQPRLPVRGAKSQSELPRLCHFAASRATST